MSEDSAAPAGLMRVIDFETTALDASGSVIEAGWTDVDRVSGEIGESASSLYFADAVPPEVRAVSHIWQDDIAGEMMFDGEQFVADAIEAGCLGLVAHNAAFEAQWLERHIGPDTIRLICTFKAGLRLWPDAPAHNNFALLYFLIDQGEIEIPDRSLISPPHRAKPDSYATALILGAIIRRKVTGQELVQWTREPALYPRCPIGEHRGKLWREVDNGFLNWMVGKKDMDPDYVFCARKELDRRVMGQ